MGQVGSLPGAVRAGPRSSRDPRADLSARVRRAALRRALAALHARGQRRPRRVEPGEPSLVALGERLARASVNANRDRFAGRGWRFLLATPPSWAGEVWFADLAAGLAHTGLFVRRLGPGEPVGEAVLEEARPDVLIALDADERLVRIDVPAVLAYKRRHGLLRLAVPTRDDAFRTPETLTPGEARRLAAAVRGDVADAYLSLYEPEHWRIAHRPLADAGFRYVSLPQSGNPLEDRPVLADRVYDWFHASVCSPERLDATWAGLRAVLWRHRGDWAGQGWGFGDGPVPPAAMPARMAAARVVLSPLLPRLRTGLFELTHRVFEAAACGAFQLSIEAPVTRRYFSERALACARGDGDFAERLRWWLPRSDERARAAEAALEELYAGHTVFHRVDALVGAIEELASRH